MGKKNKKEGKVLRFERERKRCLEVHVAGAGGKEKVYELPLAGSLDLGESMALMRAYNAPKKRRDNAFFMWFYDFVCKHVDKRAVDSLSADQFRAIAEAWQGESDDEGVGPGE